MEIKQEIQSYINFLNEDLIDLDSSFMVMFFKQILIGIETNEKFPEILKK